MNHSLSNSRATSQASRAAFVAMLSICDTTWAGAHWSRRRPNVKRSDRAEEVLSMGGGLLLVFEDTTGSPRSRRPTRSSRNARQGMD